MLVRQQQNAFCLRDRQAVNVCYTKTLNNAFYSTFTPESPELSRSGRTIQLISERRVRVEYDTHPEQ